MRYMELSVRRNLDLHARLSNSPHAAGFSAARRVQELEFAINPRRFEGTELTFSTWSAQR